MLALLVGNPAWAEQTDARLVSLFGQLRDAADRDAAAPIEAQIWEILGHSSDRQADKLLADGEELLAAGDGAGALVGFDHLVKVALKFAEGWNYGATTLYLLSRMIEFEADIAPVLALEPRHFGALSGLGLCQLRRDRLMEAVASFRRAMELAQNLSGARGNILKPQFEIKKRSI